MISHEGQAVPEVLFKIRTQDEWQNLHSRDLFNKRTVVVFSLPGAFTPTCSTSHVPEFNARWPEFQQSGVDEIVCIAVNDAFVMQAWQKDQNAMNIRFIADGNGEFTKAMDMLVDKSALGFGLRSWRYSMLVKDGRIIKQFIEPEKPGDPFEVSDASTMLNYLQPGRARSKPTCIITQPGCAHCAVAKSLLQKNAVVYEELILGQHISGQMLMALSGRQSVPQIFIQGKHIGGAEDLRHYLSSTQEPTPHQGAVVTMGS